MKGARLAAGFVMLVAATTAVAAGDGVIAVQCAVEGYRSSYAPRPETFVVQVDLDSKRLVTYYGSLPLKLGRREIRGVGMVDGGWTASVILDRRTGRLQAGTNRIDGRKYSYAEIRGSCILPPALQGAGYKPEP